MKKILSVLLILALILAMTACGGGNSAKIVGTWKLADGEGGEYGVGMRFNKDGTLDFDMGELASALGEISGEELSGDDLEAGLDAMADMGGLMEVKYKLKSDTVMEITVSLLGGLGGKESEEVEYSLNGDTLVIGSDTYTRVK